MDDVHFSEDDRHTTLCGQVLNVGEFCKNVFTWDRFKRYVTCDGCIFILFIRAAEGNAVEGVVYSTRQRSNTGCILVNLSNQVQDGT